MSDIVTIGTMRYVVQADTAEYMRSMDAVDKSTVKTSNLFGKLSQAALAVASALSVSKVIAYADAWATVNNKLANSIKQNEKLADVTDRVFKIAQNTRSSVDATASLYARLERATRDYGTSANDLIKLTETINRGFIVSGATAQEAENAVVQLSQGLASGALRGEEFNSVNEQGNRLIVALADSLGKTTGEMRALASQGKLTTDVVVKGLLKQASAIENEYNKTLATFAQNTQKAEQNLMRFIGENNTVKEVVAGAGKAIVVASENIQEIAKVSAALAAVFAARMMPSILAVTAAFVSAQVQAIRYQATLASMAGVSRTAAAATGILAGSVSAFNSALALIGGPAGAAFLAAAAIIYYYTTAETAAEKSKRLSGEVDTLSESFKGLTAAQRQVAISKLNTEMDAVRQKLIAANTALNNWTDTAKTDPMAYQQVRRYKQEVEDLNETLNKLSTEQQALFQSGLPSITNTTEETKKAGTIVSDEVKKITDALADEHKQLTMTADGYEEYALRKELSAKNASKSTIDAAVKDLKALQALRKEVDLMNQVDEENAARKQTLTTEVKTIAESGQDPLTKLQAERDRQLALVAEYEALETANHETAVQARAAIDQQYESQRMLAAEQSFAMQSAGNKMLIDGLNSLSGTVSQVFTGMLTQTMSVQDAVRGLANAILNDAINSLVQLGLQYVKNAIIGQSAEAAAAATSAAAGATVAAAWAPAAAAVSLASYGANAAPAATGITATYGLTQALSVAGGRRYGGGVGYGSNYEVAEGGKTELYIPQSGNPMLMGSKGGQVVSNSDLMAAMSGGGQSVNVDVQIINQGSPMEVTSQQSGFDEATGRRFIKLWVSNFRAKGETYRAVTTGTNAKGRTD